MENMNDYQIQDGDIRKVRRVEIRDDWDSPEQIAHPVSEEKVQELSLIHISEPTRP